MTTITIGKRLIPIEQIALVEPFDSTATHKIQTEKTFRSRVVLLDRESVLAEFEPHSFAEDHGFRWIMADQTATNPAIHFSVETFTPTPDFAPKKAYLSRIVWRDPEGNTQSKLMIAEPETLLAIAVRGDTETAEPSGQPPSSPAVRGRQKPRRRQPVAQPT